MTVYAISEDTIALAHRSAIMRVMKYGREVITEDNEVTLECSPLLIHVNHPLNNPRIYSDVGIGPKMMKEYSDQLHRVTNTSFSYTYGNRLMDYNGVNQLQYVIRKLTMVPTTRRAIMHTWMVPIDTVNEHVPCMQTIQFTIRNKMVNCVATFRSNDMLMAWGANCYALSELLRTVSSSINVPVGYIETFSNCPHVYPIRDKHIIDSILR